MDNFGKSYQFLETVLSGSWFGYPFRRWSMITTLQRKHLVSVINCRPCFLNIIWVRKVKTFFYTHLHALLIIFVVDIPTQKWSTEILLHVFHIDLSTNLVIDLILRTWLSTNLFAPHVVVKHYKAFSSSFRRCSLNYSLIKTEWQQFYSFWLQYSRSKSILSDILIMLPLLLSKFYNLSYYFTYRTPV